MKREDPVSNDYGKEKRIERERERKKKELGERLREIENKCEKTLREILRKNEIEKLKD